jgi:HPt (histidine-containing phosphotransfer) domain-containing protein
MDSTAEDSGKARTPVYDRATALAHLANDESMLSELASIFLDRVGQSVEVVRSAVADRNGSSLYKAAHRLEGSLATFFAAPSIDAARELARAGKNGDWQEANEQLTRLIHELDLLIVALRQLMLDEYD